MTFSHRSHARHFTFPFILAFFSTCYSGLLVAEGAVRIFDCSLERACDAAGSCEPESGKVNFHMAPIQLDDNGAGTYQLTYENMEIAMQAISDAGPFTWAVANERHTLLVNSENQLLWHQLPMTAPLLSVSHYMQCTLRQ